MTLSHIPSEPRDDELKRFEAEGGTPLPTASEQGYVTHEGARIWYATYGSGPTVVLLHGGLGHGGNWGNQVPMLVASGYRAVLVDSRGHGRSTRDARPYSYEQMASDVLAVLDAVHVGKAAFIGWSDGACTSLILARKFPARVAGVFFFGCNMDPSGTKAIDFTNPLLARCIERHVKDYARLSATPDEFQPFFDAVIEMQRTQPNYSATDLAEIRTPVTIVQSENDEFIKPEHAMYLARSIPGAELVMLSGVTHFAPLQRPDEFNRVVRSFLQKVLH